MSKECKIKFIDDLDIDYEIKLMEFSVNEKGKYNRAKKIQEDKKMIKEWEDSEK